VPKAPLSLREPTKQLQYVTVCSGLFWFRSKSRTGRTSVLLLHRVYLLPTCLLQVDGATSGRTDFQEEHENKRTAPLRLAIAYVPPVAGCGGQSRLRRGKNILSFSLSACLQQVDRRLADPSHRALRSQPPATCSASSIARLRFTRSFVFAKIVPVSWYCWNAVLVSVRFRSVAVRFRTRQERRLQHAEKNIPPASTLPPACIRQARATPAKNARRTHAVTSLSLRSTSLHCGAYQQYHEFQEHYRVTRYVDSFFIVFGGAGGIMVFSRGLCLRRLLSPLIKSAPA